MREKDIRFVFLDPKPGTIFFYNNSPYALSIKRPEVICEKTIKNYPFFVFQIETYNFTTKALHSITLNSELYFDAIMDHAEEMIGAWTNVHKGKDKQKKDTKKEQTMKIKELMKQIVELEAQLQTEIRNGNQEEILVSLFEPIFEIDPNFKAMRVIGWTPGFNDGDPCTHSDHFHFGFREPSKWDDRWYSYDFEEEGDSDIFEFFGAEGPEEDVAESAINDNVSAESQDAIIAAANELSGLLERIIGTNWEIRAKRNEDGTISIENNYYECGY